MIFLPLGAAAGYSVKGILFRQLYTFPQVQPRRGPVTAHPRSWQPRCVGGRDDRAGQAIPHFNEADECAGLDAVLTNRVHRALGQPVENTLHDLRWGDYDQSGTVSDFVWVFEISGAAPPAHHIDGWAGSQSFRQPPMYFRLGGGTLKGIAKPGDIVWSRIFVDAGALKMDIGTGRVVRSEEHTSELQSH